MVRQVRHSSMVNGTMELKAMELKAMELKPSRILESTN